jgi:hypothetical protein
MARATEGEGEGRWRQQLRDGGCDDEGEREKGDMETERQPAEDVGMEKDTAITKRRMACKHGIVPRCRARGLTLVGRKRAACCRWKTPSRVGKPAAHPCTVSAHSVLSE